MKRLKSNMPLNHSGVRSLLQQTRTVGSIIPHSSQRKIILRANLFGLISVRGWPAFFLTVSPNDLHSPIVKLQQLLCSDDNFERLVKLLESDGNLSMEDDLFHTQFVNNSNGNDPVSCARYFHYVVEQVLQHVIGFQANDQSYKKSIFGQVNSHFGVIEQQQRKQLHIHMLVWVDHLEDYEKFHKHLENLDFKTPFLEYLNQILSTTLSEETVEGRSCSQYVCPSLTENATSTIKKQIAWTQRQKQLHHCSKFHCMKKGKSCRYGYPKPLVGSTYYDEKLKKISFQRNHQWLNNSIAPISVVFRYNNDVQFLPGNGPPHVARYNLFYDAFLTLVVGTLRITVRTIHQRMRQPV